VKSSYSKKDMTKDAASLNFELDNEAVSLGFFWGTLISKKGERPLDEVTRKIYDKVIKRLYCEFARTILKLQKEKNNSKVWKMLAENARMQIRWKNKR